MTAGGSADGTFVRRVAETLAAAILLIAVAVAFADSSIVVLALPELLGEFDVSIAGVAWVVTSYNLVLALAALALVLTGRRFTPRRLTALGTAIFLLASVGCAAAPEVWSLVAFRAAQGLGGALLLVGALSLVGRTALWAGASVVGAALGPALGGLLTEAFSWRAIFVVQAPIAALGLVAVVALRERAPSATTATSARRGRLTANIALALASAALVGLLFLAVLELVNVRLLSPLRAGLVVSALVGATLLVQPLAASRRRGTTAAGLLLLAGGLAGMAFVPSRELSWTVLALVVGGAGYGIAVPRLTRVALSGGMPGSGAMTVWTRHAGLVAGLLVVTPLLASDLPRAGEQAELRGIALVLDAPLPARAKVELAIELAPVLSRPPRAGLPDFSRELADRDEPELREIGHELDETVQSSVSRGFRRSFLVAALFALLAIAAVALQRRAVSLRAPAVALAVVGTLLAAELAAGARSYGARPSIVPPCGERRPPPAALIASLDLVACGLDTTREELLSDLARRGVRGAELVDELERSTGRVAGLTAWAKDRLRSLLGPP